MYSAYYENENRNFGGFVPDIYYRSQSLVTTGGIELRTP